MIQTHLISSLVHLSEHTCKYHIQCAYDSREADLPLKNLKTDAATPVCPLVAGWRRAHTLVPLHVSKWCMSQTRTFKLMTSKCFLKMVLSFLVLFILITLMLVFLFSSAWLGFHLKPLKSCKILIIRLSMCTVFRSKSSHLCLGRGSKLCQPQ